MKEFLIYLLNRFTPLAVLASGVGGVSTNDGTLGGGQILQVGGDDWTYEYFNESAINIFKYYTHVKVASSNSNTLNIKNNGYTKYI